MLLGEEGVGKSTLIVWLMAQLTQGKLAGDCSGAPVHCGIIGDEDDFDRIWTPKFHAADADVAYVHYIERSNFGYIDLTADRDKLKAAVQEFDIEFLYLDQLLDNLGSQH